MSKVYGQIDGVDVVDGMTTSLVTGATYRYAGGRVQVWCRNDKSWSDCTSYVVYDLERFASPGHIIRAGIPTKELDHDPRLQAAVEMARLALELDKPIIKTDSRTTGKSTSKVYGQIDKIDVVDGMFTYANGNVYRYADGFRWYWVAPEWCMSDVQEVCNDLHERFAIPDDIIRNEISTSELSLNPKLQAAVAKAKGEVTDEMLYEIFAKKRYEPLEYDATISAPDSRPINHTTSLPYGIYVVPQHVAFSKPDKGGA